MDEKFVQYAVNHVNEDHAAAMLTILKSFSQVDWPTKAILITYNNENMQVTGYDSLEREEVFQIAFPRKLENAQEFRPVLIEMLTTARK
jgi:putative heme iron utilization protein